MLKHDDAYVLSAGDLTGHLGCAHRTNLDRLVADGLASAPRAYADPMLDALMELGRRHEADYVKRLKQSGLSIVEIEGVGVSPANVAATREAMKAGADIIVQAALRHEHWSGRPDILRRTGTPSRLGAWSYEPLDTKLARETTGSTVLQLSLYSELLELTQGVRPEFAYVVSPADGDVREEAWRVDAYGAFYRRVKRALEASLAVAPVASYPEPVSACDICRWFEQCDEQRRKDDHPAFVAGLGRNHVNELREQQLGTLTQFAEAATPFAWKPRRGSIETYAALQKQAKVQLAGRAAEKPIHELIAYQPGLGLARLPAPSKGDIFLDFEGDPHVGNGGLEYLFGYVFAHDTGALVYRADWALNAEAEKKAFETFIDFVIDRQKVHPGLHIYHYAPYEPSALKRLMGRYATREEELDGLLRSERFVDLYAVVRNGVRASVESYSIKRLEAFYGFARQVALLDANRSLGRLQAALELGHSLDDLAGDRDVVQGYNEDDCRSTAGLRDWLETLRAELIAGGAPDERPEPKTTEAIEKVTQRLEAERALAASLTDGVPADPLERSDEQSARWLLAQLIGWHRREDKASFHEGYRLRDLSADELIDERCALSGLVFEKEIEPGPTPVHRYRFPAQETELRGGEPLFSPGGVPFGKVVEVIASASRVDIKKRKDTAQSHVDAAYTWSHVDTDSLAASVARIAQDVVDRGMDASGDYQPARDLLLRAAPQAGDGGLRLAGEKLDAAAVRVIGAMTNGTLPIQGPPGAGKTYTGARMIASLIAAGKKVGVTATSHKVTLHLIEEAIKAAAGDGQAINAVHKASADATAPHANITIQTKPGKVGTKAVIDAINDGIQLAGGTAWLWADADMHGMVDVLFVDEAAQMSLANVLAVSQAAPTLVLLGDPRQLEQPSKGSHPDGADASALDHILSGQKTIGEHQGLFLAETWRLHPDICDFTSELFYENRLDPLGGLKQQRVKSSGRLNGAGLRYLPVAHTGNQNSSIEEVEAIRTLVEETLAGAPTWVDRHGKEHPLELKDILIVAPYNAQVFALREALPNAHIGTVDKFQGQEAPIVIYSMGSSSASDAPRGMEFLYSLNRLNVATSRARAICVLVAAPALFEAECRTPRQMELANALCRYMEMAKEI
jgi:predicted RecB family nuclease